MKLSTLLKDIPFCACEGVDLSCDVTQVTSFSSQVIPGGLFVCLDGLHTQGSHYIEYAIAAGAVAIVRTTAMRLDLRAPSIFVADTRIALALLCSAFWEHPERALRITAVTGTNGKTSTTHYLEEIYRHFGYRTAMTGTICDMVCNTKLPPSGMTTPDPELFYRRLAYFRSKGVTHLFMEASSHALALDKLVGIRFANGIFTNLSPEHLDFHKTLDAYLAAKSKLFPLCERSFFNIDDSAGARLFTIFSPLQTCFSYAVHCNSSHFQAVDRKDYGVNGIAYCLKYREDRVASIQTIAPGSFSFYNTLAAASCACMDQIPADCIAEALSTSAGIAGHMENITPKGLPFSVLIDFAHTPDALQKTLEHIQAMASPGQRILLLFGCGGDRDPSKRATMGEIAVSNADFVYITEDNNRSESFSNISDMICSKIRNRENFVVIEDRATAIKTAIMQAKPNDILLLCGKGHEDYIIRGTEKIPFSEQAIVQEAAKERESEENGC